MVDEYLALWEDHGIAGAEKLSALVGKTQTSLPKPGLAPEKISARSAPATVATTNETAPICTTLEEVQAWLGNCKRCGLCETRNKIVFGVGNPQAKLMFVGEGPGADEDAQGLPFVGKAGQLLDKIIEAMGYQRSQVYIANVVKCRPPGNRLPEPAEANACMPFLKTQIDLIKPDTIVALGLTAATYLGGKETTMSRLRGKFHPVAWKNEIQFLPTYHPAYLLRNPDAKKLVWDDMKIVMKRLGK